MRKDKLQILADFYTEAAKPGKKIETLGNGKWYEPHDQCSPDIRAPMEYWRVVDDKPKIVDLSPLVKSGVWCEFSDDPDFDGTDRAFLVAIRPFEDDHLRQQWNHCRPLLNHWNVVSGGFRKPEGIDSEVSIAGLVGIKYTGLQEGWEWP